jgi:polyisoprenoid-binding protein YceI
MEVMLDSLRTGQGTRDRHMREALETTQFPTARFELDSLRLVDTGGDVFTENVTIAVRLHGRFRVHGVWRPMVATGTINHASPNAWRLTASFPVKLGDHNITKGLSRAFGAIRVEQEIRITIESEFSAG